jgi:protein-S-isoprenylcysteine O-methyltransferase Ste14
VVYIAIGVLGIYAVLLCDLVAIKGLPIVKTLSFVTGSSLVVYSLTMSALWPEKIALPDWASWFGWTLFTISLMLLVYSLVVNLPLRKTYLSRGVGDHLITGGFYALTRHPGVLWFTFLVISLLLASKSRLMLVAAPLLILLDVIAVVLQERLFLGRMFPGYKEYRRQTPMLVPNRKSFKAFVKSLTQSEEGNKSGRTING